jgi:Mg2+ and Co2+ transporter CorA
MATDPSPNGAHAAPDDVSDDVTIWTHLDRTDSVAVATVGARHGIPPDHFAALTPLPASPRIDDHGNYLFVSLQLPLATSTARVGAVAALSAVVTADRLLTLQTGAASTFGRIHRECLDDIVRRREFLRGGPSALLSRLVAQWIGGCSTQLDALREETSEIANLLLGGPEAGSLEAARDPDAVAALLRLRRQSAHVRRLLEAQWPLIDSIAGLPIRPYSPDAARLAWRSAASQMAAVTTRAAALCEDVDGLLLAIGALNAQQTSGHTRLLTLLAGALLPIMVVLILFATNTQDLPLVAEPRGFETILALAAVIGLLCLYLLRRRL